MSAETGTPKAEVRDRASQLLRAKNHVCMAIACVEAAADIAGPVPSSLIGVQPRLREILDDIELAIRENKEEGEG